MAEAKDTFPRKVAYDVTSMELTKNIVWKATNLSASGLEYALTPESENLLRETKARYTLKDSAQFGANFPESMALAAAEAIDQGGRTVGAFHRLYGSLTHLYRRMRGKSN